jgi:hypothetical protein
MKCQLSLWRKGHYVSGWNDILIQLPLVYPTSTGYAATILQDLGVQMLTQGMPVRLLLCRMTLT